MTDRATVTYLVEGTTHEIVITGPRLKVQMRDFASVVRITDDEGSMVRSLHFFRSAEHIHVERNV